MKFITKKTNKRKGFTLVETLVAIAIFTVSILAVMAVLANSISDTNYAKKKMTAAYLAQEGIEYVRNKRDTSILSSSSSQDGWDDFKNHFLSGTAGGIFYPVDPNFSSDFERIISADIITFGDDEVKITSKVKWTQGSGTYDITFSENLYNWVE